MTTKICKKGHWITKRRFGSKPKHKEIMVPFLSFLAVNFKSWYKEYNKYIMKAYSPKLGKKQAIIPSP